MKKMLLLAAAAMVVCAPAYAAGQCSTSAKDKFQPQAKLEAVVKAEGLTLKQVKVEKGCYEVYATDKDGKRVNVAYNAETLAKLDNAEAGEN